MATRPLFVLVDMSTIVPSFNSKAPTVFFSFATFTRFLFSQQMSKQNSWEKSLLRLRSWAVQLSPFYDHVDLLGIDHFTVVCLVAKPLNRNEAKCDLVMIQTLLLFKCKLFCYHANWILVSITTRSPSASLQIKGLATKYITVKWPIVIGCFIQERLDVR